MSETRRTPRYPFSAPAEIVVESSLAERLCRVKELSLYGCYLDSSLSLGLQNRALLKIYGPHEYFEASATVIYTHPLQGMGMVFREIRPAFANVLQKWLLESMRKHTEQINENR